MQRLTPMLKEEDCSTLKQRFKKELKGEVKFTLFTQGVAASLLYVPGREQCRYCPETRQLLEELVSTSDKLKLDIVDFYTQSDVAKEYGVDKIPAIVLNTNGNRNLRYYGIPMGYEFATLVEDLITISRGVSLLHPNTRKALRKLQGPVHIQVFVTPTWQFCPAMARLAHAMALENPGITADVVEAQEFPALSQRYGVTSVPRTLINERVQIKGAVAEQEFLNRILEAVDQKPAAAPSQP